jgi:hypothetical protein
MAASLRRTIVVACVMMLIGCSAPWNSGSRNSMPTPAIEHRPPEPSAVGGRSPAPTIVAEPTVIPMSATPTTASQDQKSPTASTTPTLQATPTLVETRVAHCCGIFSWVDARRLLVFDDPRQGETGAWIIDPPTGSRQFMAPNFGLPSTTGLIAVPNRETNRTEIRSPDGSIISTIDNGGMLTWISPDGKRVAWLEDMGVRQTSSLVPRTVRLWSAGIDGNDAKSVLEFRASALQWLPDSQHVIALGRAPNGERPGIWVVDTSTGANGVVVTGTFLQALRRSNDGSRMAYLETFSSDSGQNGVWIANTNGSDRVHLREIGSFRWGGDASHLWFLQLAPRDGGNDILVRIDLRDDSVAERVDLGGRVLNDQWEVSPDGASVAYWSEADQSVIVRALPR